MDTVEECFALDWKNVADRAAAFICEQMAAARRQHAVIGLSGGIDSAVSAWLATRALGPGALTAFMLPYRTSNPDSLAHAKLVADELGIAREVIEITPMVDAYFVDFPDADRMRRANMMARQRMAVLYDQSERLRALVIGTGNRTEGLLGYTTLWGDMAAAFNPVGDLYKTQVRALAAHLGVPQRIIEKPPSADLWKGQTDEGELGLTYDDADRILTRLIDRGLSEQDIVAEGFDESVVRRVAETHLRSEFKRRMPPAPSLREAAAVRPTPEGS